MGVQAWITVRGNHIPIMDGESKAQALSNFFKSKRKVARGKRFNKHMDKMDEYAHKYGRQYERESDIKGGIYDEDEIYDMAHADAEIDADDYMEHKYGKNWNKYSKYDIKGRQRTLEERNREFDKLFDKYQPEEQEKAKAFKGLSAQKRKNLASDEAVYRASKEIQNKYQDNKQVGLGVGRREYKLKVDEPKRTIKGRAPSKEERISNLGKDEIIGLYDKSKSYNPAYAKVTRGRFKDDYYKDVYNKNAPYLHKDYLKREMDTFSEQKIRNTRTGETTKLNSRYKSAKLAKRLEGRRTIDEVMTSIYGKDWEKLARKKKK